MKREQLAINSVSTGGASLEERLAAYAAAGFPNVEFMLGHVKEWLAQGRSPADARRLIESHGLRCIGGFETGLEAFSPPEQRTRNHRQVQDNARLIAEIGGNALVVGTDGPSGPMDDPLGELAQAFADVAGQIADTGVSLCIEFNWSPIVKSLRTAAEVARRSGAANVGVLFDPAHYHCTPSKMEQLTPETVALIKHVHVDDMRDKPGELSNCNSDRELPGDGVLPLRELFGRIEAGGYRGFFSIEMFSDALWALPPEEAARRMYRSLLPLCED
ncbi:MAG: sugar phosphate isomerase/epimerase [Armatimonadetes bacterium]|nr:sugar phosphate isomerase/epimerase [Armatimonadota bacterium]